MLSKFVYLERKGANYWACCPFHKEKTPSFQVKPQSQSYHCYGCGLSGNVITFIMEHERLTYPEAVEWLAERAGMELPSAETEEQKKARQKKETALAILKLTARFYVDNLYKDNAAIALEYIAKRGLTPQTVQDFGIGYSANYFDLPNYLTKAGYSKESQIYAGVVSEFENKVTDFEGGRLVIPIINAKSQVIAFGGRRLDGKKEYKYKNTAATALFDKRRTLFAINMIKKQQQKEVVKSLILVEGYMDVISLYQAGIKNAIASMGTSLTKEQCSEIKRYTSNIYVCFDGDAAGQNGTWRSLDMLNSVGLDVRVVSMPDGLDPDDTIKKVGKEGFLDIVDKALPLIEFKLKKISLDYNLTSLDGKNKYAQTALSVLVDLDKITQAVYIKEISAISGLSEDSINNALQNYSVKEPTFTPAKQTELRSEFTADMRARIIACRFILSSILSIKNYVDFAALQEEFFEYPIHLEIFKYMCRCVASGVAPKEGDLFDYAPNGATEITKIIDAVTTVPVAEQKNYYNDCLNNLVKNYKKKQIATLVAKINTLEDGEQKLLLQQKLLKLIKSK